MRHLYPVTSPVAAASVILTVLLASPIFTAHDVLTGPAAVHHCFSPSTWQCCGLAPSSSTLADSVKFNWQHLPVSPDEVGVARLQNRLHSSGLLGHGTETRMRHLYPVTSQVGVFSTSYRDNNVCVIAVSRPPDVYKRLILIWRNLTQCAAKMSSIADFVANLLLLSGDIETNPGPDTLVSEDVSSLSQILKLQF
uniref:Putative secreted protein n=1 Tax=Ixodes ricinus TaxID=34613 RepID=A0A6B0V1Q9_IXORI